jgi:hypothetical protein
MADALRIACHILAYRPSFTGKDIGTEVAGGIHLRRKLAQGFGGCRLFAAQKFSRAALEQLASAAVR